MHPCTNGALYAAAPTVTFNVLNCSLCSIRALHKCCTLCCTNNPTQCTNCRQCNTRKLQKMWHYLCCKNSAAQCTNCSGIHACCSTYGTIYAAQTVQSDALNASSALHACCTNVALYAAQTVPFDAPSASSALVQSDALTESSAIQACCTNVALRAVFKSYTNASFKTTYVNSLKYFQSVGFLSDNIERCIIKEYSD
jgi:hypothetical protein